MGKSKDQIYCKHILQAIAGIEQFTRGLNFEKFSDDFKTQLAVTRELEIIGEASKRLSLDFKKKRPNIPWRQIAGISKAA